MKRTSTMQLRFVDPTPSGVPSPRHRCAVCRERGAARVAVTIPMRQDRTDVCFSLRVFVHRACYPNPIAESALIAVVRKILANTLEVPPA